MTPAQRALRAWETAGGIEAEPGSSELIWTAPSDRDSDAGSVAPCRRDQAARAVWLGGSALPEIRI